MQDGETTGRSILRTVRDWWKTVRYPDDENASEKTGGELPAAGGYRVCRECIGRWMEVPLYSAGRCVRELSDQVRSEDKDGEFLFDVRRTSMRRSKSRSLIYCLVGSAGVL